MSSEWREYTVEELIKDGVIAPPMDGNHGEIHPKASDFVEFGVPFIMASDLRDGQVDLINCSFISPEQASRLRKGFAKNGDVLLSHKATIGRTALVNNFEGEYLVLTPQVTYYRVLDSQKLNNRYLKYYFDSRSFQETMNTWSGSGSTRAYLGITAQRKLPIVLPPLSLQLKIASVIGALDDRIALLRETNSTLEAIAQALFKSWFVDFDPVRAKAEGRTPDGMDAATAALFPDSFEESELGLIPKGWRVGTLSDLCAISSGKRPPDRSEGKTEYFHVPLYGGAGLMGYTSSVLFNKEQIVTGRVGTLGKVHVAHAPFWASDNVLVISPVMSIDFNFALQLVCTIDIHSLNRGSTQPLLTQRDLGSQQVIIPDEGLRERYQEVSGVLHEKIRIQNLTIEKLVDLRDAILPRLISGQLRLPDAEAELAAEEVAL